MYSVEKTDSMTSFEDNPWTHMYLICSQVTTAAEFHSSYFFQGSGVSQLAAQSACLNPNLVYFLQ